MEPLATGRVERSLVWGYRVGLHRLWAWAWGYGGRVTLVTGWGYRTLVLGLGLGYTGYRLGATGAAGRASVKYAWAISGATRLGTITCCLLTWDYRAATRVGLSGLHT
eukprot:1394207-Amorphochlora_amoeboformis.AAC.1